MYTCSRSLTSDKSLYLLLLSIECCCQEDINNKEQLLRAWQAFSLKPVMRVSFLFHFQISMLRKGLAVSHGFHIIHAHDSHSYRFRKRIVVTQMCPLIKNSGIASSSSSSSSSSAPPPSSPSPSPSSSFLLPLGIDMLLPSYGFDPWIVSSCTFLLQRLVTHGFFCLSCPLRWVFFLGLRKMWPALGRLTLFLDRWIHSLWEKLSAKQWYSKAFMLDHSDLAVTL